MNTNVLGKGALRKAFVDMLLEEHLNNGKNLIKVIENFLRTHMFSLVHYAKVISDGKKGIKDQDVQAIMFYFLLYDTIDAENIDLCELSTAFLKREGGMGNIIILAWAIVKTLPLDDEKIPLKRIEWMERQIVGMFQ